MTRVVVLVCMHHTLTLATSLCISAALLAQRPDTGPETGISRLAFESIVLGGRPAVEHLEVNGKVHDLGELRQRIVDDGTAMARTPRVLLEDLVLGVLRDELLQCDSWLDDGAFATAYDEYSKPYKAPFTVEIVATGFKKYPSLDDFKRRWRVLRSFVDTLPADALTGDALAAEAKASAALLTGSKLEVELWFHPAEVSKDGRGDFTLATQLARQTKAVLSAGGDEPAKLPIGVEYSRVGDDRPIAFNTMRNKVGESEYTLLLRDGVTEALFVAEPGELLGPLRGAGGVYIARVGKHNEGPNAVDLAGERGQALVRELLVQRLFQQWLDQVFAKTIIRAPRR